jgi:hypothetical protein
MKEKIYSVINIKLKTMKRICEGFVKRVLLSTFFVILNILSFGSTYYVSPSGSDSNTGTITSPWATLNKAWTALKAGDTVYLRGGTYAFNTQQSLTGKNGISGSLINILAYPNEAPILTKSAGYPATFGIFFSGNYFYWKGIEIAGYTQPSESVLSYGIRVENSSYNTFENLKVHGNGCGMTIVNNGYTLHATGNLILNCDFYENQDPLTTNDPYGNADGLSIAWITHPEDVNTVTGCRFWWNSDDGIDMFSDDGRVILENCQSFYNGYIPNTFTPAGDGIGFKFGNNITDLRTSLRRTAKNCISVKNRTKGYSTNGIYGLIELDNCSAYLNGSIGIHLADYNLANSATNCLSYANGVCTGLSTTGTYLTNSWQNKITISDADFKSIDTSLLLAARNSDGSLPVTDFLKLTSTSKLINSGTDVGIPYSGTAPDIGSYEASSVSVIDLPTVYNVTGGGSFCDGGNGVAVGLSNSQVGIYYQLQLNGVNTGSPVAGTGNALSFGNKSVAGTYTVVATNILTTAISTMTGSAIVTVNPVPAVTFTNGVSSANVGSTGNVYTTQAGMSNYLWTVSAGGTITSGGGISNNSVTITWNTSGTQSVSVNYSNITGCTSSVAANYSVTINASPLIYAVTGGGSFCNGGNGVAVGLSNSQVGINYQLQLNGVNTGSPVVGTGNALSFGNKSVAGTYTVFATNVSTGANSIMTGSAIVTVNPMYAISENVTIKEGATYQGWTASGQYIRTLTSRFGCDSIVTTNLTVEKLAIQNVTEITQTIQLKKGNNLISTYLIPNKIDAGVVVKSLINSSNLNFMQDEDGNTISYSSQTGDWVNNIGAVKPTEGYLLNANNNCTLTIVGTPITFPLAIPLKSGWNIISYPRTDAVNAMSIVQPLIDQNKLVKVQDELGNSIENLKKYGGWRNNIGDFTPGKAYKVYVSSNTTLNIQANYAKSSVILPQSALAEHYKAIFEGNGFNHMNINLVDLNSKLGISAGDELAAFDGNICVGALKITQDQVINGWVSLIASYSTRDQVIDGFTEGNQIKIYRWDHKIGTETEVQLQIVDGELKYAQNGSVLVSINSLATTITNLLDASKIKIFPNPSTGRFIVQFSEISDSGSQIDILDLSGRIILSRNISGSSEEFNLENQPTGIYIVKTTSGSSQIIHKLIISK